MIDDMLQHNRDQYQTLLKAKERPYILDDATVEGVIWVYTGQLNDHWIFEEQLSRWKQGNLNSGQKQEVEKLAKQLKQPEELYHSILALANELTKSAIERVPGKSDIEVALDVLSGKLKP